MRRAIKGILTRYLSPHMYDSLRSGIRLISGREYSAAFRKLDDCLRAGRQSLDCEQVKATLRQAAHILDRGCQRDGFEPGHGRHLYDRAQAALRQLATEEGTQKKSD